MLERDTAIVVTTIFPPAFLAGFLDNLRSRETGERTRVIVIPDRKTPASVVQACVQAVAAGFAVECPGLQEQTTFLKRLEAPADWIPFDSDNRRNIGYLMALQQGCDVIISIDDDNFCPPDDDYVGKHLAVGNQIEIEQRTGSDGWLNLCEDLEFDGDRPPPFARGFPYGRRHGTREVMQETVSARIALNAGLWLDDPDVDAIGRLSERPKVTKYAGSPFVLGTDTWSPINTQNTGVSRAAMAAYYYVRMGFPIEGLKIDRYGDILSGYFVQKCIQHMGESIRIGDPICRHLRTPHNLFKDLYHELAGMVLVEELLPWLREVKLTGATYNEAYACLAEELEAAAPRFQGFVFDQGGRDFLVATAANMRTWLTALRVLGI